jgi:hypothetical protein
MMTSTRVVAAFRLATIGFATLALTACFATQQPSSSGALASLPGFWHGLWHGCIAPIAFIASLFSDHIRIYAVPHAGRWYDFGFMIGVGGFTHGVWHGNRMRKRTTGAPPGEGRANE